MKESFIYTFKITYFKKLLLEGFNNSPEITKVLLKDKSGYGEFILSIEDLHFIDSIVRADNKIMVADSIIRIGKVAEGSQGKHIFDYALKKYKSKWLDQISKQRAKIYENIQKIAEY
ncbi:MAG: hypothetical protein JST34_15975 [Bacteroidetes bacterium]|nr:hypothetical protein [Bacteroidota bacterium]